jgi:Domain of unknown function (DUF4440)
MNTRKLLLALSILAVVLFAARSLTLAQTGSKASVVAAITKIENDGVTADLANDKTFSEKILADDWTGADSDGTWYTKAEVLKQFDDPANNKTNSEKISGLKVRIYGIACWLPTASCTAIATYKDTYDAVTEGKHRSRSVLTTDTFVIIGGEWKEVASHSCQTK